MFSLHFTKKQEYVPDPCKVRFLKRKLSLKVKGFYFFRKIPLKSNSKLSKTIAIRLVLTSQFPTDYHRMVQVVAFDCYQIAVL